MIKIILLQNLSEDNVNEVDSALEFAGVIYRISLKDKAVIIEGDNDALHRAKVALAANGFILK